MIYKDLLKKETYIATKGMGKRVPKKKNLFSGFEEFLELYERLFIDFLVVRNFGLKFSHPGRNLGVRSKAVISHLKETKVP